ncbi:MAG: M15 family metallopeptidase, partial [Bacilli bacterium]|nr:M15 family metallopeptidase [Bacilli bacterium]
MKHIDLFDFRKIPNFDINKLERYISYHKKNNYDLKTVVTYVNIGLDFPGYSYFNNYTIEQVNNNLTILINKYHMLPKDYEPNDLVTLSYNNNYAYKLRKEAAEAYEKLAQDALQNNVIIYPFSAYRSYDKQNKLYSRYKARDGEKAADTYSARPGFSEHQLGLAIDVRSSTLTDNLTPSDYEWILNNS